jgi:organic radical activating enzyme
VAEAFGPVWQGEGPAAGQRALFLRLGLCNLSCHWCDSAFTWNEQAYDLAQEISQEVEPWRLLDALPDASLLVLTGGEPLLHRSNPLLLETLSRWLATPGHRLHVETNGTIGPPPWASLAEVWSLSPKVAQNDDPLKKRIKPRVLEQWSSVPGALLKIVVRDLRDLDTFAAMLPDWGPWRPEQVWVMPEGETAEQVLAVAQQVKESTMTHGWNFTLRQHVLLYGTERGR